MGAKKISFCFFKFIINKIKNCQEEFICKIFISEIVYLTKLHQNEFSEFFKVTNYDFYGKIRKIKMANLIWLTIQINNYTSEYICHEIIHLLVVLLQRSLITLLH